MNEQKIRLCKSCIDALAADVADKLIQKSGTADTGFVTKELRAWYNSRLEK